MSTAGCGGAAPGTWQAVAWDDGKVVLLDQRRLPRQHCYVRLESCLEVAHAIRDMVVRGAPAIGIAAAYGVALAARGRYRDTPASWRAGLNVDIDTLRQARPTAVNLGWALDRMIGVATTVESDPFERLLREARSVHAEDIRANREMGRLGANEIAARCCVITHCNAGALATGGYGTALGVIRHAHGEGKIEQVFADETRPWLQGARLTAWELVQDAIPVQLIADAAASAVMRTREIGWVIVGADRVAANGDVANKIGTYSLAVNARHHGVGFMVVAPCSTIDLACPDGDAIPIERRSPNELLTFGEERIAASGALAWNPVFDVTPAGLVDLLVTERGVVRAPDRNKIATIMGAP